MARILHPKKYGWFTPSVSQMFSLAHSKGWPRQPIPFDMLNFMDDVNKDHFTWPANLYSAGHAHLDPVKSNEREKMIQLRDRTNSVLVGDSGGFQAATGVLEFDWADPTGPKSIEQRTEIIRWLEYTADYSMILDWPAWAIPTGRLPEHLIRNDPTANSTEFDVDFNAADYETEHETLSPAFIHCVRGTVWNNHWFAKNRVPGATKFLNVLQGRNIQEAYAWYDAVTPFSKPEFVEEKYGKDREFEGWALGGSTGGDPSLTMRLLVKLRRDGLLDGGDRWIHVLGRSRLSTAVYIAALNESLSRNLNENIQISYDASSAFLYAVNGNYVTDFACSPKGLNLISAEWPMGRKYIRQADKSAEELLVDSFDYGALPFPYAGVSAERLASPDHYKSPLSQDARLRMDEFILAPTDKKVAAWEAFLNTPEDVVKAMSADELKKHNINKPPADHKKFRMDTASYYYIMAHNVQMQAYAVEKVCDYLFAENAIELLPSIFIDFKDFVNRLFATHKPWGELTDAEKDDYTAKSMALCDAEANKFKDLISGERSGVSAFEDPSLFTDASQLKDFDPHAKRERPKKPVKVEKVKMIDVGADLFSFSEPKQSNG